MRFKAHCVLVGAILLSSYGCSQKSARLQKSVIPPDKTLYDRGIDYLKKGRFTESRLAFQTFLSTYPDSELAPEAYFAMGDSFYEEGGTENLLLAEDQYENFIIFYPGSPKSADAHLKRISLNNKLMNSPDRDQQYAHKALQLIKQFEQMFPKHDYLPMVRKLGVSVEDNLAKGEFGIGQFYEENKNNLAGALGRYKEIPEQYPEYAGMDEVLYATGRLYERAQNQDEAAIYYTRIAKEFPFSKFFEESIGRLIVLGKEVPSVDTRLASINEARIKPPEGFSPLKPLIDFTKALGFVAPPDQYELTRKAVEVEKARSAESAAAQAHREDGGDDIQIESEIRKSVSESTQSETGLTDGSSDITADGVSKKNSSRYKKKPSKKP